MLPPPVLVSFGGGINSTAFLIEAAKRGERVDKVVFADTGGEKPETYAHIERFSGWLVGHGLPPVEICRYTTREGKAQTLEEHCLGTRRLPSLAYGFKSCSQRFKRDQVQKVCNRWPEAQAAWKEGQKVISWIGYEAGEEYRMKRHQAQLAEIEAFYGDGRTDDAKAWLRQNGHEETAKAIEDIEATWAAAGVKTRRDWWEVLAGKKDGTGRCIGGVPLPVIPYAVRRQAALAADRKPDAALKKSRVWADHRKFDYRYPLIEWDMDRLDCSALVMETLGYLPPKSSCFFCPASSVSEIRALAVEHPELLARALAIEANAESTSGHEPKLGRWTKWADVVIDPTLEAPAPEIACECMD